MKNISIILSTFLLVSSCYSYKTYEAEEVKNKETNNEVQAIQKKELAARNRVSKLSELSISKKDVSKNDLKSGTSDDRNNAQETIQEAIVTPQEIEVSPKTIIKEKGYYQLEAFDQSYKIEAVKWEGDTIIGFVKGKPKKELKFHQKDIQNLKVRQFSKARSDAFTVASYAAAGIGIFLLLK